MDVEIIIVIVGLISKIQNDYAFYFTAQNNKGRHRRPFLSETNRNLVTCYFNIVNMVSCGSTWVTSLVDKSKVNSSL